MLMLVVTAVAADCDLQALEDRIDEVEAAFVEMAPDFPELQPRLETAVGCLTEPLDPSLAARVHRAFALLYFFEQDDGAARASLSRMRELDPSSTLSDELAPRGNPLQELYADPINDLSFLTLPEPALGWILIDGEQVTRAPRNLPWVFQHLSDQGGVIETRSIRLDGKVPTYETATPTLADQVRRKKGPGVLTWVGVGTLGAGVISYGAGLAVRESYRDAVLAGDEPVIRSTHTTANALGFTSVGLLAAGTGLTIAGAF